MPEFLGQEVAHITSGTALCRHMPASILLLWKMRIMDFVEQVAVSPSQGVIAIYPAEECQPNPC